MPERSPTQPAPSKPAPPAAVAALVPQGAQTGKPAMPLGRPFTLVGSRNRAHLHLLSSSVSRNHACVIGTDNGLYLRDLASRTGILVNGRKIKEVDLRDGDKVQIGSFKFKFTDPAGPIRFPITPKAPQALLEIDAATLTPLDGRTLLIGSRHTCDIALEEPAVSSTHALIFEVNGHRFIRDLGSRTGTLVNGKPVHHQPLEFGDQVRIGDTTFRYLSADAPREAIDDGASLVEHDDHEASIGLSDADQGRVPWQVKPRQATVEELLGVEPLAEERVPPGPVPVPVAEAAATADEKAEVEAERVGPIEFATADVEAEPVAAPEPPASADFQLPGEHALTAPTDVAAANESIDMDFSAAEADQAVSPEAAPEEAPATDEIVPLDAPAATMESAEAVAAADVSLPPEFSEVPESAASGQAETPIEPQPIEESEPTPLVSIPADEPREVKAENAPTDLAVSPVPVEPVDPLEPVQEVESIDQPLLDVGAPARVEEVDLSAVKFDDEPAPAEEPPTEPVDAAPTVPTPILDLVTETPALPEPPVPLAPVEAETELSARGKRKRARKPKKARAAGRQDSPTTWKTDSDADQPPAEPLAPADSVIDAPEPLVPPAIQQTPAPAPLASEAIVTSDAVEVLDQTDPTPESALAVDPALEAIEPAAPAPAPDSLQEAALTDPEFDRAVEDFAGPELGPLVEEPEHVLTADVSFEDSLDLDPALLSPMSASSTAESLEAALDLEPVSEPPIVDSHFVTADESLEPPLPLDELPAPGDPLGEADVVASPPGEVEAGPIEEEASAAPPLESPAPPAAVHPFFGMERDLGSFIGGIPLSLAAKVPPWQPSAAEPSSQAPPPHAAPVEPAPQPAASASPPDLKPPPAEETLTFTDEPEPIPGLEFDLTSEEEPLDLFDETSHQLDAMPDALDALPDVGRALASPQGPADPPNSDVSSPGAPSPAASPARPKITPPPPPKTSPLRSFTVGPAGVRPEEMPAMEAEVPPFAGTRPATHGRVTRAFDGLAMPPVRETDVFSHTAFPPLDEAIFGPPVREVPAIPPAGSEPAQPPLVGLAALSSGEGTDFAPAPVPPQTGRTPRERKREAIPPNRQSALRRQPGQAPPPAVATQPPPPAAPPRRPWWKNIKFLLPLLFLAMILAAAAILFFVNPHNLVRGTLQINGLKELTVFDRKQQLRDLRAVILDAAVRQDAAENLKNQSAGVAPGFLQDPAAIDQLSQPANSSLDEARGALLLSRQTSDPEGDKLRMKSLLTVVYERYKSRTDAAASTREEYDQAQAKVLDREARKAAENAQVRKLTDEINGLAGQGARDLLVDLSAAVTALQQQDHQLRGAWDAAAMVVRQRQAELQRTQLAGAASSGRQTESGPDPSVKPMRQSLAELQTRLEAARLAHDGNSEQAAKTFQNELRRFEQQLSSLPASNANARFADDLDHVRRGLGDVRELNDQIVARRQQDDQALTQLRKQLADRRQAYRQQVWDRDEKLKELLEEQDAQSHRYQAAANSGYAQDAAKIQGVLEELDGKIKARRAALDTGQQQPDDLQQMQDTIARIEKDRVTDEQQMRERLSALEAAVKDAPAGAGETVSALADGATALKTARDRYATAIALSADSAANEIKTLEGQVADQQAKLDARQQDLANAAAARLAADQDRKAATEAARQALSAAQDAQQKAATAYTANSSLLIVCRELNDARGQAGKTSEELDAARRDVASRKAELDRSLTVLPPDDTSVAFSYGQDERLGYLVGALLAVVLLFAGPLWLSVSRPREEEVPYAAAIAIGHEVPGHASDDYVSSADLQHHEEPAIA